MRRLISVVFICAALPFGTALASIHHTKAQQAYFDEHDRCVKQLREARKLARTKPAGERKAAISAAKAEYAHCEAWARLVWKYYPQRPPTNALQANGRDASGDRAHEKQ